MEVKTIIVLAIVIGCFAFGGKNVFKNNGGSGSGGSSSKGSGGSSGGGESA